MTQTPKTAHGHPRKRPAREVVRSSPLTRHGRAFTLNISAPEVYARLGEALKSERARIEAHNPPVGALFQIATRNRWRNLGLRATYRGECNLTRVSEELTHVDLSLRPRFRFLRNLHLFAPALVLPFVLGPVGIPIGLGIAAIVIWLLLRHKPASHLDRMVAILREERTSSLIEGAENTLDSAADPIVELPRPKAA